MLCRPLISFLPNFVPFRFDPAIHLNLEMPDYVRVFPDFKKMKKTPEFFGDANGSKFAYSSPFQVSSLSDQILNESLSFSNHILGVQWRRHASAEENHQTGGKARRSTLQFTGQQNRATWPLLHVPLCQGHSNLQRIARTFQSYCWRGTRSSSFLNELSSSKWFAQIPKRQGDGDQMLQGGIEL